MTGFFHKITPKGFYYYRKLLNIFVDLSWSSTIFKKIQMYSIAAIRRLRNLKWVSNSPVPNIGHSPPLISDWKSTILTWGNRKKSINLSLLPRIKYGINSSRSPDVVPAEAGNHLKHWIPVFTPAYRNACTSTCRHGNDRKRRFRHLWTDNSW